MAAIRPLVLVYQEHANATPTAATPDLNCLIAGPAYWIQDFPEDRDSIRLDQIYGAVDTPATGNSAAPVDGTPQIILADPPNNSIGAILDAASVRVFFGNTRVEVAYGADGVGVAGETTYTSAAVNFLEEGVRAGDLLQLSDGSATFTTRVRSVDVGGLTVSDELPGPDYDLFRVERAVAEEEIDALYFSVRAGTNEISINGGVEVDGRKVLSAEVYVAYRSLRQDLADVRTLERSAIPQALGRLDARNPLAVAAHVAAQNTPTTIQVYGVTSDDATGYTQMKDSIAGRKDIYAVTPLTTNLSVIASLKNDFENMADPDYALTNGVPQKFRVVVAGAPNLPTVKTVVDNALDGQAEPVDGTSQNGLHGVEIDGVNLVSLGVRPGYQISFDGGDVYYLISHVTGVNSLEVLEELPSSFPSPDILIQDPHGATSPVSGAVTVTNVPDLYLDLRSESAKFLDRGVMPGDFVSIGEDRWAVASVLSNQRLRIRNEGRNSPLWASELPHGATRIEPVELVGALTFSVVRALDRAGQVDELASMPQSLNSRRAVLVWPDAVEVDGLVDGSLPRAPSNPLDRRPAGPQPSYYLAAAVGGMVAGLPSHQGFTKLGIAGISKLYNSNTYFSDPEISRISRAGYMVFQQDNEKALPYCIHQLTTDPAMLATGEFSMVKNFDFVSLGYADTLDAFIGVYNITPEALGFLRTALQARTDSLKLNKRPKIGSTIIDGRVASVEQSEIADDRVELYVELDMPAPLNNVGLHLVSV